MIYFYARVSSKEQNLARQMEQSEDYKKPDRIFCEKKSAESFDRPSYQEMRELLAELYDFYQETYDILFENFQTINHAVTSRSSWEGFERRLTSERPKPSNS